MADAGNTDLRLRVPSGSDPKTAAVVQEELNRIPTTIARKLSSFSGASTQFSIVSGTPNAGIYTPPSIYRGRDVPLRYRGIADFGRPQIEIDQNSVGTHAYARATVHHEIGHRISSAIAGNNYQHQGTELGHPSRGAYHSYAVTPEFVQAYVNDLRAAGYPPPPGTYFPVGKIRDYLLPRLLPDGSIDPTDVHRAAEEGFADIYAARYSSSLTPEVQRDLLPEQRTDFRLFRSSGPLIDRAVTSFAGASVAPVHPNPGDYPNGESPRPLTRQTDEHGAVIFDPVRENEPHDVVVRKPKKTNPFASVLGL